LLVASVHTALGRAPEKRLAALANGANAAVRPLRSAPQAVIIGGIAAAAAFGLARLVARSAVGPGLS